MTELFFDKYNGEMFFDIVSCEKEADEYVMVAKAEYKGETIGFQFSVPVIIRKGLFKVVKFVKTGSQIKFSSIGEESDRFICALEELLKPTYKSSKRFSEEVETLDFSVLNREMYDLDTDKIHLKIFNGEDQSDFEEDEKINIEMNLAFNVQNCKATLVEIRDGYSADLVAALMK